MPTENKPAEPFQRENRYIVIKRSDMEKAQVKVRFGFETHCRRLHDAMFSNGAPVRSFLVIESDWPEYEPAWRMIERRVADLPDELSATRSELSALREELERQKRYVEINANSAHGKHKEGQRYRDERDALQLRLNAADQRIDELTQKHPDDGQALIEDHRRFIAGEYEDLIDQASDFQDRAYALGIAQGKHKSGEECPSEPAAYIYTCNFDALQSVVFKEHKDRINVSHDGWVEQALYTSPPAPVSADAAHDRAYRNGMMAGFQFGISGNEKGYAVAVARYDSEIIAAKADQPSKAQLVLPQPMCLGHANNPYRNQLIHDGYTSGWNACRAEVIRINTPQ